MRKNSATKPPGTSILVNKSINGNAAKAVNTNGTTQLEPLNNFEKSQPKDDLEIKKQRDESIGRAAAKKDGKKTKPNNKKDASPAFEKVTTLGSQLETVDSHLNVPVAEVATVAVVPKDSPKNVPNKEKSNKKKRNDALLVQQLGEYPAARRRSAHITHFLICVFILL